MTMNELAVANRYAHAIEAIESDLKEGEQLVSDAFQVSARAARDRRDAACLAALEKEQKSLLEAGDDARAVKQVRLQCQKDLAAAESAYEAGIAEANRIFKIRMDEVGENHDLQRDFADLLYDEGKAALLPQDRK